MRRKTQIFISYSSIDKKTVDEIIKKIEDLQIRVWKAPECIKPGSNYAREIPKAIRESALFLLFLSGHSQKSIWVEKEVDTAVSARIQIIPFQLDEAPMSDMYHFYLNNVQMIPYTINPEKAIRDLRQQIQEVIAAEMREISANTDEIAVSDSQDISDKEKKNLPPKISPRLIKTNELRKNKIPLYCEVCANTNLKQTTLGVYTCIKCGHENYDDYTKIRNYIKSAGSATIFEISKQTGVSRERINAYLEDCNQDYQRKGSGQTVCQVCKLPIASGNICRACLSKGKSTGTEEGKRFRIVRNKT